MEATEAAYIYAQRLLQEERLLKLKGDNPILDQVVSTKSGITVKEVLGNYLQVRKPFLKPGTVENYTYLMKRLSPLHEFEAETLSNAEITKYIGNLKNEGLSN